MVLTMADYTEITVFGYADPKTPLDVLQNVTDPKALNELNNEGSGNFAIALSDPKIEANPSLLDYRNVVKVSVNGTVRSAFLLGQRQDAIVDSGEDSSKRVIVSGNGLRQWLADAEVYPEGTLTQQSPNDRIFSWASQKGTWYTASDWKAPVKIESYNMLPPSTGRIWNFQPAEWPDAPNAWWVWSQAMQNGTDPRFPKVHPAGDVYFRYEFDTTGEASYSIFAAADDRFQLYVDSALAIDAADTGGQSYETIRYDFTLGAGHHVLAAKVTNDTLTGSIGRGPGAFICALFRSGDATLNIPATLIATTGDSGWVCQGYPAKAPGWSIGEIMLTLLSEASARGVLFPSWLTPSFTRSVDSNGVPWADNLPLSFEVGTSYLDVLKAMESLAVEAWIDPDTYAFNIVQTRGTDRSVVTSTRDAVSLVEGYNLLTAGTDGEADLTNSLLMKTNEGWLVTQPTDGTSQSRYGRLEGTLSTNVSSSWSQRLASRLFAQKALAEQASTYTIIPRPGAVPFTDFDIGDWVLGPDATGAMVRRRVVSLSFGVGAAGEVQYAIEFDTIFQTKDAEYERLNRLVTGSNLGAGFAPSNGGGSGGTAPVSGTGTPTASSSNPVPPANFAVQSVGYFSPTGAALSRATFSWDFVQNAVDGSVVRGISRYEILGRRANTPADLYLSLATVTGSFNQVVVQNLPAGEDFFFTIRAYVSSGRVSDYAAPLAHTTSAPVVKLPPPTAPVLTSALGVISVAWDGKLTSGSTLPPQFSYVYAEYSTASTGPWTKAGSTTAGAGSITIGGQALGSTVYVRLTAVDNITHTSDPSASASVVVQGIQTADLGSQFASDYAGVKKTATDALANAGTAQGTANTANKTAQDAATAAVTAKQAADAAAARSTDYIKDPQFQTGADRVRGITIGSPADANGVNLPNGAVGYGRVTGYDNLTDGTTVPAIPGKTYRLSVDVRPGAAWQPGSEDFHMMTWYLNTDGASSNVYVVGGTASFTAASNGWQTVNFDYTVPASPPWSFFRPSLRAGSSNPFLVTNFRVRDITDAKTALDLANAAQATAKDAAAAAKTANDNLVVANQNAQDAARKAGLAQDTADGKNTVWYLDSAPTVTNSKIGDTWFNTSDGNKMSNWNGSAWVLKLYGTNAIADLAITNAKISNLDAAKITTGFLDAGRIQAASITVNMLAVGDFTDYFDGGSFDNPNNLPWLGIPDNTVVLDQNQYVSGNQSLRVGPSSNTRSYPLRRDISVKAGQVYYFESWVFMDGSFNGNPALVFTDPKAGTSIGTLSLIPVAANNWYKVTGTITTSGSTTSMRVNMTANNTAGNMWLDDMTFKQQYNGTLIADGSITSPKVAANSIDTNNLKAGAVTAPIIASNAITTDKLDAYAITAKHNIVGALIQTATSGARTEMTSQGIRVLDSNNVEQVRLGYGISTGMSVMDSVTQTLIPLSPMITGTRQFKATLNWKMSGSPNVGSFGPWNVFPPYNTTPMLRASSPTGRFLVLTKITAPAALQQNHNMRMAAFFYYPSLTADVTTNLIGNFANADAVGDYNYHGMDYFQTTPNREFLIRGNVCVNSSYQAAGTPQINDMIIVVMPL
jgi:hypothetical protein